MGLLKKFNINMVSGETLMNEKLELIKGVAISCSECGTNNSKDSNYCMCCGHKLRKINKRDRAYREYCPFCKEIITNDMDYCGNCGSKIERNRKEKVCPICGELNGVQNYCINCGHDFFQFLGCGNSREMHYGDTLKKKCPNCNTKHPLNNNYCESCGTKLVKK